MAGGLEYLGLLHCVRNVVSVHLCSRYESTASMLNCFQTTSSNASFSQSGRHLEYFTLYFILFDIARSKMLPVGTDMFTL